MTLSAPQPDTRAPTAKPAWLQQDAEVYDTDRRRWGVVMSLGFPDGQVWLRPPAGGIEWTPRIADLSPTAPASSVEAQ
jgi:hypothetical protein